MTEAARRVWIVAGQGTCRRWSRALSEVGLEALELPWGEPAPAEDLETACALLRQGEGDLVLFTSRNAVEVLPEHVGTGHRSACVGHGTAKAARARGFEVVLVGQAGGEVLARRLLGGRPSTRDVLFLRGHEARPEAQAVLEAAGVTVRSLAVYRMDLRARFEADVGQAAEPAALLLGSPRAADVLRGALKSARRELPMALALVAPGAVTAEHAATILGRAIHVAEHVNPAGLAKAVLASLETLEEQQHG